MTRAKSRVPQRLSRYQWLNGPADHRLTVFGPDPVSRLAMAMAADEDPDLPLLPESERPDYWHTIADVRFLRSVRATAELMVAA